MGRAGSPLPSALPEPGRDDAQLLGPDGTWGLTHITASDEALLLRLLLAAKTGCSTLRHADYALRLMAHVIAAQRWGVPAGAPARLTAHVKNGWLPLATHGWRIHSIGGFTGHGGVTASSC